MRNTFRGGIRFSSTLHDAKERALNSPIRVFVSDRIVISLHTERYTLTPCVKTGDTVKIGDRLAVDNSENEPPIHSGIAGTVTVDDKTIAVISDGTQAKGALLPPVSADADPNTLVQRMYDAGLVGLGGAGFPTHRKYRNVTAQHLLINACECEPYLAGDGRLVIEQERAVYDGVTALMNAGRVSPDGVYLCAESPRLAGALRRIAEGTAWRTVCLPERYPQGCERQLIRAVLGKELPQGTYPTEHGILVSNLATAVAMADALRGLPLTHRVVTVSGVVAQPCNLLAPIGTPLRMLAAEAVPLITGRWSQLIAGGAMTGKRVSSPDMGLPKPCGGILVLPTESDNESPCIRCGACVRACPSGLMPFLIERAWLQNDDALCDELRADACISCGCCSRVCPARRQLAARITRLRRKGGRV